MMPELRIHAYPEKARDTTLDDEKNNRNIIECCNNTHQGLHVAANEAIALLTSVTLVTLLVPKRKLRLPAYQISWMIE